MTSEPENTRLSSPVSGTDMVMVPREPTEAMMDAGLYHSSHDSEYGDVHSVWKGMFDAATLSGGSSAYAIAAPGIEPLDGNDIWEALFGILKGDVPDALTEEVCSKLATALSASPTPPIPMIAEAGVEVTQRQKNPICADYSEHFLIAHVSKDGKTVGIDHPCDADWADVMTAHVALRDRINDRIAEQDGCPFKPRSGPMIAEAGEREAQGTFACPICGDDKPHHHTAPVVDAYQTKGSRK